MTDDPAGPVIDPPGSSRAEQPPPYQWIVDRPSAVSRCLACRRSRRHARWKTSTERGVASRNA